MPTQAFQCSGCNPTQRSSLNQALTYAKPSQTDVSQNRETHTYSKSVQAYHLQTEAAQMNIMNNTSYTLKKGKMHRPYDVHHALNGFISFVIELLK